MMLAPLPPLFIREFALVPFSFPLFQCPASRHPAVHEVVTRRGLYIFGFRIALWGCCS